jgi:hypothetical protein
MDLIEINGFELKLFMWCRPVFNEVKTQESVPRFIGLATYRAKAYLCEEDNKYPLNFQISI